MVVLKRTGETLKMSSSLGPFNCITGDGLPITAYILTLSNSQQATTADGASSETQTYIALLRANANETQEVTFYRIIVIDKENANDDQVFQLCRLSSLECAIQARTTDVNVSSDKHSSGQKKGKNVYLSVTDDLDVSTLDEIKGFVIKPEVTVLPPPSENIVIFGSKLEGDIFQRALCYHSESMDTSITSVESDDTKPKANAKRRKRSAGSFTVSLRRTSSTDSSEPLAYEVIGMKLAPIKKRKASITVTPTEPISNFYFLLPEGEYDVFTTEESTSAGNDKLFVWNTTIYRLCPGIRLLCLIIFPSEARKTDLIRSSQRQQKECKH
jgi:hypothetical protein